MLINPDPLRDHVLLCDHLDYRPGSIQLRPLYSALMHCRYVSIKTLVSKKIIFRDHARLCFMYSKSQCVPKSHVVFEILSNVTSKY